MHPSPFTITNPTIQPTFQCFHATCPQVRPSAERQASAWQRWGGGGGLCCHRRLHGHQICLQGTSNSPQTGRKVRVLGGISCICMLLSVVGFLLVTLTSRLLNLAYYDAFLARVLKTDFYDPASGACGSGSCPPAPEEKGGGPGGGGPPGGLKGSGEVARPVGGGGHWRHGGHQDNQGGRDYQNRNNHQARY